MKSVLIALLLVAVLSLLLVAAEAKRQRGKEKPAGGRRQWLKKVKECPRNCSDCEEGICRECDDDFVLRSNRFNKTTCEPCGRKLKMKEPALFLQHCVTECSKNCSSCGDNGNCEICQDGFFKVQTRLLQRTVCVRCSWKMKKNWPDVYKKQCSGLHECPRNCSDCEEGICRECDDDFVLRSNRFNKTTCEPCGRKLKMKEPALFLQHCVTECSKTCSSCGDNGNCEICQDGFFKVQTRLLQRTVCVPCGWRMKKNWPDVYKKECRLHACGRNCTNCNMDSVCTECEGELKLYAPPGSNFTKCVKKCPLFHKLVKGSSPTRCEVKQVKKTVKSKCKKMCAECTESGVCTKCKGNLKLVRLGKLSACKNRCPFPSKKLCEKRIARTRKGGKMSVSADLP